MKWCPTDTACHGLLPDRHDSCEPQKHLFRYVKTKYFVYIYQQFDEIVMKKGCIVILLLLSAALGLQAQTPDISDCRLIKVYAVLVSQDGKDLSEADPPITVNFTLCYGGQSSGYAYHDYIYLLGDKSDNWNRYGCMGFMDMPKSAKIFNQLKGDNYLTQCIFWGNDSNMGLATAEPGNGAEHGSGNYVLVSSGDNKNYINYMVISCDFYDISSGKERLVAEKHFPWLCDYDSADNLFRTFMTNMYEYYR